MSKTQLALKSPPGTVQVQGTPFSALGINYSARDRVLTPFLLQLVHRSVSVFRRPSSSPNLWTTLLIRSGSRTIAKLPP